MFTLILYTAIAVTGIGQSTQVVYGWRPVVSNLEDENACRKAARKLAIDGVIPKHECISSKG